MISSCSIVHYHHHQGHHHRGHHHDHHLGKIGGRKVVSGNQDGSVIVRLEWDTSVAIPRLIIIIEDDEGDRDDSKLNNNNNHTVLETDVSPKL